MKAATVLQLNELNRQFYAQTATHFSETRAYAWPGWEILLPTFRDVLKEQSAAILDIGCGNGRFAEFLDEHIQDLQFSYLGIDSSKELLTIAVQKKILQQSMFQQEDLIQKLVCNEPFFERPTQFSLITVFGVLHHIPSLQLRKALLTELKKYLAPNGLLIFTAWQFDKLSNLFDRRISAQSAQFAVDDLEPNDYFLTWENDPKRIRYCHLIAETEANEIITATGLKIENSFESDGRFQQNTYYVCRLF